MQRELAAVYAVPADTLPACDTADNAGCYHTPISPRWPPGCCAGCAASSFRPVSFAHDARRRAVCGRWSRSAFVHFAAVFVCPIQCMGHTCAAHGIDVCGGGSQSMRDGPSMIPRPGTQLCRVYGPMGTSADISAQEDVAAGRAVVHGMCTRRVQRSRISNSSCSNVHTSIKIGPGRAQMPIPV